MRRCIPWYGEFLMTVSTGLTVLVLGIYMFMVPCLGSGFGLTLAGRDLLLLIAFQSGILLTAGLSLAGVSSENHCAPMQIVRSVALALNLAITALVAARWVRGEFSAAIEIPLIVTTAVNLLALAMSLRNWSIPAHICEYCGYDLRGSDSRRCPECGELRFGS